MKARVYLLFLLAVTRPGLAELTISQEQFGDRLFFASPVQSIKLDGALDEEEWKTTDVLTGFSAARGIAKFRTEIRALFSGTDVYLGIRCEAESRESLKTRYPEGGKVYRDDSIEIFFDPLHNSKKCHQIIVNAIGTVTVIDKNTNQYTGRKDYLDAKAKWDEKLKSYTIEIALNRGRFGLTGQRTHSMGVGFLRNQQASGDSSRAYRFKWHSADPRRWGHLFLMDGKTFDALKLEYSRRLNAIEQAQVPDSVGKAAAVLKAAIEELPAQKERLTEFEGKLIALEREGLKLHWRHRFEELFD